MVRANCVSQDSGRSKLERNSIGKSDRSKKQRLAGGVGEPLQRDIGGVLNSAGDRSRAFRYAAQARADILTLQCWRKRLALVSASNGDAFAAADANSEELSRLYAACYEVFELAYHAGDSFDAICGISFDALETSLEFAAWHLAPPELRHRIGSSMAWMITPAGLVSNA